MELQEIKNGDSYEVINFEKVKASYQAYVNSLSMLNTVIQNTDDFKKVKEERKEVKSLSKVVSDRRKSLVKLFSSQYQEIEKLLDAAEDTLSEKIHDYEINALGKAKAPTKHKLTIASKNESLIEDLTLKIKDLVKGHEEEVEIKYE